MFTRLPDEIFNPVPTVNPVASPPELHPPIVVAVALLVSTIKFPPTLSVAVNDAVLLFMPTLLLDRLPPIKGVDVLELSI